MEVQIEYIKSLDVHLELRLYQGEIATSSLSLLLLQTRDGRHTFAKSKPGSI